MGAGREPAADDRGGGSAAGRKGPDALSVGLSKAGSAPQDRPSSAIYGIGFGRIRQPAETGTHGL